MTRAEATGPHQAWTSNSRQAVDRLLAWGLLWMALSLITVALAFALVPTVPTWRHYIAATLFAIQGLGMLVISIKLVNIVIRKKGRRRRW